METYVSHILMEVMFMKNTTTAIKEIAKTIYYVSKGMVLGATSVIVAFMTICMGLFIFDPDWRRKTSKYFDKLQGCDVKKPYTYVSNKD
jgi:hypothetical protein